MTDTEVQPTPDQHRTFQVVVNNDLLAGAAVFVIVMTLLLGIGYVWSKNVDNNSYEKRDHIAACANIEVAAEKTLCLDKT